MKKDNNFLQPVISTFGLAISLLTAILPLFSVNTLTSLFIDVELAKLTSFLSFIIGVALIWQILQTYTEIHLGKLKDRGKGFPEYWKVIRGKDIVWLLIILSILLGAIFLYIGLTKNNTPHQLLFSLLQALVYLLFFLSLISTFAFLFTLTKRRYTYEEERENFPQTIFETLEKNRLIKPGIEVYQNQWVTQKERENWGITGIGPMKKIRVKTNPQDVEVIEFVVSSDGREIEKVLKKKKIDS